MPRPEFITACRDQFMKLIEQMAPRQLVYGELQFFRGMFCGQGATIEEIDIVVNELHGSGVLPNIFDMLDEQDKELLRAKGEAA